MRHISDFTENGAIPDIAEAAAELTSILALDQVGRAIVGARIVGRGATASADLFLDDGSEVYFATIRDFANPTRLGIELASQAGAKPRLKAPAALDAVVLLRQLAARQEGATEDDISVEWGSEYLQAARLEEVDMADQADRWRAFSAMNGYTPGLGHPQIVLLDRGGQRYVRTGWFREVVRERAHISPHELALRMERVGWSRAGNRGKIKASRPGYRGTLIWAFYTVPPGWDE